MTKDSMKIQHIVLLPVIVFSILFYFSIPVFAELSRDEIIERALLRTQTEYRAERESPPVQLAQNRQSAPVATLPSVMPIVKTEAPLSTPTPTIKEEAAVQTTQTPVPASPYKKFHFPEDKKSDQDRWPSKVRLFAGSGTGRRGIFYADYFQPLYFSENKDALVFFNPKESLSAPYAEEINLGLGARRIVNNSFILGANYFFDRRVSTSKNRYSQNGYGLEFLSEPVDLRFNIYNPVTGPQTLDTNYDFGSTHLVKVDSMEEPLKGFDFEVGVPIAEKYTKTRGYVGGIFYDSKLGEDLRGTRVRTETSLNKWLKADTTFDFVGAGKLEFVGGVRVTVPFMWGRPRSGENIAKYVDPGMNYLQDRLFERVVRDLDIKSAAPTVKQDDPNVEMIYVNNTNTTGSQDGSYEHPYSTLAGAFTSSRYGTGKYVYVFKGDGTSTGYTGNYMLANSVTLWGSGYDGGYKGLPAVGDPVINGGGSGAVITLGDSDVVQGLTIRNGTRGVFGKDITSALVRNNTITAQSQEGVIFDVGGSLTSTLRVDNNNITNCSGWGGIFTVARNNANVDIILSNNISSNNINTGAPQYAQVYASSFTGRGVRIDYGNNATGTVTMTGNTMNSNYGYGILVQGNQTSVINGVVLTNNTLSNNSGDGVFILGMNATSYIDNITARNNVAVGNTGRGLYFYTRHNGTSFLTVEDNFSSNNGFYNLPILHFAGTLSASINRNTITSSTSDCGIMLRASNGTTMNASLSENVVTGNTNNGIVIGYAGYSGTYNIDLGGGSLGSAGQNSIYSNTGFDLKNVTSTAVSAQDNWWGTASPQASQFSGSVDYSNPLTEGPND